MITDKTTRSLSRILQKSKTEEDMQYIKSLIPDEDDDLHIYLNKLIAKKHLTITEVSKRSCVSRNYVYNIFNGQRKRPSRDKLLSIAIGMNMNYSETNRMLELSGLLPLYPKNGRDICIAIAINQMVGNVMDTNLILEKHGFKTLK